MILDNSAINVTAAVALLGFIVLVFRLVVAVGKLVGIVEQMPDAMQAIREELKTLLTDHGERIAVVEAMLDLDDHAQAMEGPRRRRRGRGGPREL